jgi:hypothetical protein
MESKQNHWIGKLMMGIMGLILAFGAATIIQIKLGNITVIVGDYNNVENGSQTQTVTQPAKPESTAPPTNQPISEQKTSPVEATPSEKTVAPAMVARKSTSRRAPINYESDDECCPADDEESEPETPQYTRHAYAHAYANDSSQAQAQSSVSVQGRNVSVQTSATGGQTRTRIVVDGRVIVDK